jgi:hypothetical protein
VIHHVVGNRVLATDLQKNAKAMNLPSKPLFLSRLFFTEKISWNKSLQFQQERMDLIVCYEQRIDQICGKQLKTLQSILLQANAKFIDCAVSPTLSYTNKYNEVQSQHSVIAICVLTSFPAVDIFQVISVTG